MTLILLYWRCTLIETLTCATVSRYCLIIEALLGPCFVSGSSFCYLSFTQLSSFYSSVPCYRMKETTSLPGMHSHLRGRLEITHRCNKIH
jgi:hypothetical protein